MITRPNASDTPTDPSVPLWVAFVTIAPQPANTSANAARPSAAARRASAGRSGIDRLERHADDRQPPGEPVQRELADVVLADSEKVLRCRVARRLQRIRH